MVLFTAVALLAVLPASGQQFVKILNDSGEAVEDAIIVYSPLDLKSYQKIAITDQTGKARLVSEKRFVLVISKMGFVTISDTLNPGESKTYTMEGNNLNLKNVIITGQFEPTVADKSVQRIRIIDRKRIEQQGAVNLRDLLTNELNVRISQDGVLGSQMSLMGLGGQNVKILIDGVPVIGRNDGNIDISQLNLNNIERVEIVEGPMSVIYGTDALGGVINLITRKPGGKQYTAGVNTYYETVGTYNIDANAGVAYKKTQFGISGGRNFFDGYSEKEDPRMRAMQWKPKEQYFADAQFRLRLNKQSHRLFSQYFDEKITARSAPVVTPYEVTGLDDYFVTIRTTNSLYSDFVFNNRATLNLINSFSTYERRKIAYVKNLVSGEENLVASPSAQDTSRFNLILLRGTYTTNTTHRVNSQLGYDINIENGEGEKLENGRQQIGDFAAFYISDIKPSKRLTLRQGIRFIYNTRYGAPVIPSLNMKYDISSSLSLRASYAQGFRAPSLKELSLFFVDINHNIKGNSNLKAERSNNFLLSLTYLKEFRKVYWKIDGSLFYNNISDMISLAISDAATQLYTYVNIDEFKTQGINLNSDAQYKNVRVSLGYSLTGRYNQLSKTSNTADFLYANEYRGNITYTFAKLKTDVSVFYKYNGEVPTYLEDNGNIYQGFTQSYQMIDASISKRLFSNRLIIIAGAKNLADVKAINFSGAATAHSSGSGSTLMAMGRYYFTSIRINLAKN